MHPSRPHAKDGPDVPPALLGSVILLSEPYSSVEYPSFHCVLIPFKKSPRHESYSLFLREKNSGRENSSRTEYEWGNNGVKNGLVWSSSGSRVVPYSEDANSEASKTSSTAGREGESSGLASNLNFFRLGSS